MEPVWAKSFQKKLEVMCARSPSGVDPIAECREYNMRLLAPVVLTFSPPDTVLTALISLLNGQGDPRGLGCLV